MTKDFGKFKRRALVNIAIKSGIIGVCTAAACVGIILLACKLAGASTLYCLIGLAGLAAGGVAFFLLRESDMQLAKKLDRTYNTGEKLQTMLFYDGESGDMIDVQREDAQRLIGEMPAKCVKFGRLWAYVAIAVVALALFVTSVAYPKPRVVAAEEPIHEITEWEHSAIDELITYVEDSKATDTLKSGVIAALKGLRMVILGGVSESSIPAFVTQTINEINNCVTEANALDIGEAQAGINSDVGAYVVRQLCDIFGLEPPEPEPSELGSGGEQQTSDPEEGGGGTGGLSVGANELFYDPERGYVSYGEVLREYMAQMEKAFTDGLISEEEWYAYLKDYFDNLYGIGDD